MQTIKKLYLDFQIFLIAESTSFLNFIFRDLFWSTLVLLPYVPDEEKRKSLPEVMCWRAFPVATEQRASSS